MFIEHYEKKERLEFLPITEIPRRFIKKHFKSNKKDERESVLIELETKLGVLSFWVDVKQVFTNNYTLNFTLSLVKTYEYIVKIAEKDYKVSGDSLFAIIAGKQGIVLPESKESKESKEVKEVK